MAMSVICPWVPAEGWWIIISALGRARRLPLAPEESWKAPMLAAMPMQMVDTSHLMQYIKCDVSTICIGMAASMGAFQLSSGAKGKRLALPNAEIMIHQPSAGTQGQITDMAIHLKRLEIIKKRMNKILSENTGKPLEVVTADCERDNYMSAEEAMEYGLIDKVIYKR